MSKNESNTRPEPREQKMMWSMRDLVGRISLGERTLWRMVSKHRFPEPVRVGRRRLWRDADVQRWIANPNGWQAV